MKLNKTGSPLTRKERNGINDNWDMIENSYKNIVEEVSNEAFEKIIEGSKIDWSEMVDTVSSLPSNPQEGETRGVKSDNKIYRYDGYNWVPIAEINLNPIAEVDNRLNTKIDDGLNSVNTQLAQTTEHLNEVEINVAYPPPPFQPLETGDANTSLFQSLVDYCIENKYKLAFPGESQEYRLGEWYISDFIEIDFKNNNIRYEGEFDFLTVNGRYSRKPRLKNFTFAGMDDRRGNGITVTRDNNGWGGSVDLENFTIHYFNQGLRLFGSYLPDFKSGRINYNNIGVEHHGIADPAFNGVFNNMNSFEDVQFLGNSTTVKSSYIRQLDFTNCSFEQTEVMFHFYRNPDFPDEIFNAVDDIIFKKCWFENIGVQYINHIKDSDGKIVPESVVDMSVVTEENCYYYNVDKYTDYYFSSRQKTIKRTLENPISATVNSPQTTYIEFDNYMLPFDLTISITRRMGKVHKMTKKMFADVFNRNVQNVKSFYEPTTQDMKNRFAIGDIFYDSSIGKFRIPIHSLHQTVYPTFSVDVEITIPSSDELPYSNSASNFLLFNDLRMTNSVPTNSQVARAVDLATRPLAHAMFITKNLSDTTKTIVDIPFKARQITCNAYINGTMMTSFGFWGENNFQRSVITESSGVARGVDAIIRLIESTGNTVTGRVVNVTDIGFEIEWSKEGMVSGNANLFINILG